MAEEIEVNDKGGKQSKLTYRMDLLPAAATLEVGKVLEEGARRYAPNNWRLIDVDSHLNHAISHIFTFLQERATGGTGSSEREELSHAACRLLMALEVYLTEEWGPDDDRLANKGNGTADRQDDTGRDHRPPTDCIHRSGCIQPGLCQRYDWQCQSRVVLNQRRELGGH